MSTFAAAPRPADPAADRTRPLISMRRISTSFGSVQALRGASVDVHVGEIVVLVGDSGAGKSALIKVMAEVVGFDPGEHDFEGSPPTSARPRMRQP